ncbi:MAG: OB-fold domain-containing protein [Rhodospirillales bacterium]|nr:OB-fold domain-containing protein [Rhodospirillales bacterium]
MNGADQIYREHLERGVFAIQHCGGCGGFVFYPRYLCPACGSSDLAFEEVCGKGTVYAATVARRRPDRGGDYSICIVQLDEGPRMTSRIDGIPPEEVHIGMAVQSVITKDDGDEEAGPYIVFQPAGES